MDVLSGVPNMLSFGSSTTIGPETSNLLVSGDVPNVGSGFFGIAFGGDRNPGMEYGSVRRRQNTYIVYSYPLMPYGDGSEERMMEGMIVFNARYIDSVHGLHAIVTLSKLNNIMRDANETYQQYLREQDPEALAFQRYLKTIGEPALEEYHRTRQSDIAGIVDFYNMATKDIYCYQTKFGILQRWNYLGVVLSKQEASSLMSIDMTASSEHVHVIGVVVGERARTFNIWGTSKETIVGSKTWLILRRARLRKDEAGGRGQFQIVPYASRVRDSIPHAVIHYHGGKDEALIRGHAWMIGTVSEGTNVNAIGAARQNALGIFTSEQGAYEATVSLPYFYLQLGI